MPTSLDIPFMLMQSLASAVVDAELVPGATSDVSDDDDPDIISTQALPSPSAPQLLIGDPAIAIVKIGNLAFLAVVQISGILVHSRQLQVISLDYLCEQGVQVSSKSWS